jgi:hypothetical protein
MFRKLFYLIKISNNVLITTDGEGSSAWYCPEASCQSTNVRQAILKCEQYWQKECKVFAKRRSIKWKNDINPGKGKQSQIKSKWSFSEVNNKLRELGFLN